MTDLRSPESDALDRVLEEARNAPLAELDWERMEQALLQRVESDRRARRVRFGFIATAGLAAAAAIALFVGRPGPALEPAPTAVAAPVQATEHAGPQVDGNALAVGDRVLADGHTTRVSYRGRADYELHSGSAARSVEQGTRLVVALERGTLDATVVPSSVPESFVVEVGDTRIAVRGTAFRVERLHTGVRVAVREGAVAVGPRGSAAIWQLGAGDGGSFSLDGQRGEVTRKLGAVADDPPVEVAAGGKAARPTLPLAPTEDELRKLLDSAAVIATGCFTDQVSHEAGVRITARTQMTVAVGPGGRVTSLSFDPPLAPNVEGCAKSKFGAMRAGPSQRGGSADRSLLLGP